MIKTYKIKMENKVYEVEVEIISEKEGIIETPKVVEVPVRIVASSKSTIVEAPMQGVVIDILVKVGDRVKPGEAILTLEAMKMENAIVAPILGTITSISINKGDTVDSGATLVIIN